MCFDSTKTQDTNSTSSTQLPTWATDAGQSVGQNAASVTANQPYQGYTGPTTGAFGSTFGTAENNETALAGATNDNYTGASNTLNTANAANAATATAPVSSLMSQYTSAALQPTLQAIQQQAATNNQGLAQTATMSGAFGDTGYGTQKALQNSQTQQNVGNATATAYNTAYNTALSTQQQALANLVSGGTASSNLGTAENTSATNANTLLGSLGATTQAANQTGINTAINVNNSNQMGQLQQDALAASTLNAAPKNSTTTGTSDTTSTQPDNTGLGLLGTLLAAA